MEELVSVIMPAYQAERFIEQSILSVVTQTYQNWELVVVNDGSSDGTETIIQRYANDYPGKIFGYRHEKNRGAAEALNTAMQYAQGKYMCWLSADDLYLESMLESQIRFLEEHPEFDAVFSKVAYIDENNKLQGVWQAEKLFEELKQENSRQPYYRLLMLGNVFHGCSLLGKKDNFVKTGRFKRQYPYATDYHYWLRFAAVSSIGFLDAYNVMGRVYPGETSALGKNDMDAIHVFCDFVQDRKAMQALALKAGLKYSDEMVRECFLQRMSAYISHDEELREVVKGFNVYLEGTKRNENICEE